MTAQTLFEKLGPELVATLEVMNESGEIVAVDCEAGEVVLITEDARRMRLEGLSEGDAERIVGWLGFYGLGKHGLGCPAFRVKPSGYPERADSLGLE